MGKAFRSNRWDGVVVYMRLCDSSFRGIACESVSAIFSTLSCSLSLSTFSDTCF